MAMIRYKFYSILVLLIFSVSLIAQDGNVTVRTVDKPLPRPLGSFIIYYTSRALEINAWEVYEVWDSKIIPQSQLVENLRDKINHSIVARYEWRPGYRWDDAARIARANSSKLAFRNSYTKVDGAGNKITGNSDGGTGYGDARRKQEDGEVIDFSKEDYVAQLPPDIINKLKDQFVKEQTRLIKNGWVRFSSNYEYTPTKYLYFNKQLDWEYTYSIIAVALDTGAVVKINNSTAGIANFVSDLPVGYYACYYDMQSPAEGITYELKITSPQNNKVPIGLIVFRRKTNLAKEVEEILAHAKNGFADLKGDILSDKPGEEVFDSKLKLGMTRFKIYYNSKDSIWICLLSGSAATPDVNKQYGKMKELVAEKVKSGLYFVETSTKDGQDFMDVYNKDKIKLFTLMSGNSTTDQGIRFYEAVVKN